MEKTKTIMEWLGDKKLYDKKIIKTIQQIKGTPLYVARPNLYADKEQMKKDMEDVKALVQSYKQLVHNRNKIQEAIMQFNATHTIEILEKKFTVAAALKMYQSYNEDLDVIIEKNVINVEIDKKNLQEKQEKEVKNLEMQLNSSTKQVGNQAFEDKLKSKKDDYEPVIEYAFDLLKELEELKNFKEEFLQKVNTKINILNVQETLTLNLED